MYYCKVPRSFKGAICLITSMITDRIRIHSVLLPIILIITLTKFVIYKALFKIKTQEIPRLFLLAMKKKKKHLSTHVMA